MKASVMHWGGRWGAPLGVVGTSVWNGLAFGSYRTWALRRAELTPFVESPFRLANATRATLAQIRTLPPRLWGADRLSAILTRTVSPLLSMLSGMPTGSRAAVSLALPERMASRDAGYVRERKQVERLFLELLAKTGVKCTLELQPRGHAGMAYGLLPAAAALAQRSVDVALVGGLDSYYHPRVVEELVRAERIFDGENLDSILPGEGAGFLLLTRREVARRQKWPLLSLLESVATAEEPGHMENEVPSTAQGLTQATRALVQRLVDEKRSLDWWLSDATSESYRVQEFQLAWPRAARGAMAPDSALEFLAPNLGELGAATLPIAAALATEGFLRGAPDARTCVATASSLGPSRAALLLSQAPRESA